MLKEYENAVSMVGVIHDTYKIDIASDDRDRVTSDIRKMFCSYIYSSTRMTMQNIAEVLNKSVGSISYYLQSHESEYKTNKAYADRYVSFISTIQESVEI